jgi:hypothetical protein
LQTNLRYEGYGWAEFGDPLIRVGGSTVVSVDERGSTAAKMEVAEIPTAASMQDGVNDLFRDTMTSFNRTVSCKLSITCANGVFTSVEQTFRGANLNLQEATASIEFHCYRSNYVENDSAPTYWRLPILNFHGELRKALRPPKVEHVMRLSEENPVSPFEMFGKPGFIEYVPGYKELLESQKNGDRNPRITAVMVGSTAGQGTGWSDLQEWFPFDFLNLVGFASGVRVGAPWIEFAGENGHLAGRTHVQLGTSLIQSGEGFMNDVIHRGGLGYLLTCAARSPEIRKTYFRVAMNHLLLGIRNSQALEDKISHLSRALEGLAAEFGFDQQYLLEAADDVVKAKVKEALKSASTEILEVAREQDALGKADIAASLRKVAERTTSNPANIDRDFGLAVLSLLNRFRLHDAAVVDAYYRAKPRSDGRQWHQVLSHFRGLTQHGDAFRFSKGEHSTDEVFCVVSHLSDIIARILLIQLGYDGEYQRATATWRDPSTTDWVTPSTLPAELGYGRNDV